MSSDGAATEEANRERKRKLARARDRRYRQRSKDGRGERIIRFKVDNPFINLMIEKGHISEPNSANDEVLAAAIRRCCDDRLSDDDDDASGDGE